MKITLHRRGKSKVLVTSDSFSDTINPESKKSRSTAAETLGIPESKLLGFLTDYGSSLDPKEYEYVDVPDAKTLAVTIRKIKESTGVERSGEPEVLFREILVLSSGDSVVSWDGGDVACLLDVDYHGSTPPSPGRLQFLVSRLQPQPSAYWTSRNGGLHALYLGGSIPADVLASVGSVCWGSMDTTATFDIIQITRLPESDVTWLKPTQDLGSLRQFLGGSVSEEAVSDWLSENSFQRGKAYVHELCPINPCESHGTPVYVGDGGIICQTCKAAGRLMGSRTPGFVSYAYLCGSTLHSDVYNMVKNLTHWSQAEVVLDARLQLRGKTAKLAYQGMLYLLHGTEDPRVKSAMKVGDGIIRGSGRWVTKSRYEGLKDLRPTLQRFPCVKDDENKVNPERLDMLCQTADLSTDGYTSIQPVFGCRMFGQFLGTGYGPVTVVMPPQDLMNSGQENLWPKYVEPEHRMDLDVAWGIIESCFPGINREYLLLLLAARAIAEGEVGLPPYILVTGPSSTGKTATVQIAASICGDNVTEIQWNQDSNRFRQSYMVGANRGTFVVIDELIKKALEKRVSPQDAFNEFLTLTPSSISHEMYTGPVKLGRLPATIVTDTNIPPDVRNDVQLGRRFVLVDLKMSGRIDWVQSLIDSGVRRCDRFRASSPERAEASNALLSYVIDEYFKDSVQPLSEIAKNLGFSTLEASDEYEPSNALPELFRCVCEADDVKPGTTDFRRWGSCGWKLIRFTDSTDVAEAWRGVCDGTETMDRFANSRKASEVDWSKIISGLPRGTSLDVSRHGRTIALRFRCGTAKGCGAKYNTELLEAT